MAAAAVQQDAPADARVARPVAETDNKPRKSGRPLGISKIDLRTVWGAQQTPASSQEPNASGGAAHCTPFPHVNPLIRRKYPWQQALLAAGASQNVEI